MSKHTLDLKALENYPGLFSDLSQKLAGKSHKVWAQKIKDALREGADILVGGILRRTGTGIKVKKSSSKKEITSIFTSGYCYRGSSIDSLKDSPVMESSENCQHFDLETTSTFLEAARALTGAGENATEKEIGDLLREQGHTFSAHQVDELKQQFVNGEKSVGLLTHVANFFFVENSKREVSVFCLHRLSDGWDVNHNPLSDSFRWRVGDRFFSRNGNS